MADINKFLKSPTNKELVNKINDIIDGIQVDAIIEYKTFINFPIIGKKNTLYVSTDRNRIYRWDSEKGAYEVVGSDWSEITHIDGNYYDK